MKNPFPAEVKKIGIAAPASSADRVRYASSRQWMSERGIVLLEAEHLFSGAPLPYLSASDEMRAEDLNRLIGDPSVDLILCLRGGYGSPRILDRIDWETLRRRRLPLVGFSDITAIHLAMLAKRAGVPVAGQMAANLSLSMRNDPTFRAFRRALDTAFHGKKRCSRSVPLEVLRVGACMGRIVTANLTLLAALCGSEWLPDFSGTILILEDIGEPLRKIDRHLTQLRHAGILGQVAGVVFAQFTDCGEPDIRRELFREFAERVDGPVLHGLAFGHEIPSLSFVCGEEGAIADGHFRY